MTKLLVMLNSVHDTKLNSHKTVMLHDSKNQHLPKKIANDFGVVSTLDSFDTWILMFLEKPAFITITIFGRSVVKYCITSKKGNVDSISSKASI